MTWSFRLWRQAGRRYFEGARLLREGRAGEAAKAFEEVVAISPRHARAVIQQARALGAAGRTGEAVRAARRAMELDPKNHAPLLALGQVYFEAGNYEEARKAFTAAARQDPENRMVQAYLGLTLLSLGKIEEGAKLIRANQDYGYEGFEARLLAYVESYLWPRRERAKTLEEQLTTEEGAREEGPAGLGLQVASAARRIVLWPLARLRGRAGLHRLLAEEAFSIRLWDKAIEHLKAAEKEGADKEDIAFALGTAYLEAQRPQEAAKEFMWLSPEARQEPEIAFLLGAALFDSGRYEEAAESLGVAAEYHTREFLPAYFRGLCDIAQGRSRQSVRWFELAASRLNPRLAWKRFEEMMRVWGEETGP